MFSNHIGVKEIKVLQWVIEDGKSYIEAVSVYVL